MKRLPVRDGSFFGFICFSSWIVQLWKGGAFYEFFHGTLVFSLFFWMDVDDSNNDHDHWMQNQNYRIQKKKRRHPSQRSPAFICPQLLFDEEIAYDGCRFFKRPYTLSIFRSWVISRACGYFHNFHFQTLCSIKKPDSDAGRNDSFLTQIFLRRNLDIFIRSQHRVHRFAG